MTTTTAATLLAAYRDYAASFAAYEQSFDLANILDQEAPEQSIAAAAGEILERRGSLERALAVALQHALDDAVSDRQRAIYQQLIWAAVED